MSQQIDKTQMYEKRIPELLSFLLRNGHKGERGRIGVVGGCELYTGHMGFQFNVKRAKNLPRLSSEKNCIILFKLKTIASAPYYAAMASLRSGGELATVFTSPDAAVPIKTYSPELMVVPKYGKCCTLSCSALLIPC